MLRRVANYYSAVNYDYCSAEEVFEEWAKKGRNINDMY